MFRKTRMQVELMNIIMSLIDERMPEYERKMSSLADTLGAFEASKVAANDMIASIESLAEKECSHDNEIHSRYLRVREKPSLTGLSFPHDNLTVGKIYIFMIWAMINRVPNKNYISAIDSHYTNTIRAVNISILEKKAE